MPLPHFLIHLYPLNTFTFPSTKKRNTITSLSLPFNTITFPSTLACPFASEVHVNLYYSSRSFGPVRSRRRRMSCLVPQFKCQPDTFPIHFRTHPPPPQLSRVNESIFVRAQCTTVSSTSTAVLELEKPRLPSIEVPLAQLATNRPWPYLRSLDSLTEVGFGSTLATETLIMSDEAVVATAAAEAVALARVAVQVSKDVALMVSSTSSPMAEPKLSLSSKDDFSSYIRPRLTEAERASILEDKTASKTEEINEPSLENFSTELDVLEPTDEELRFLEEQLVNDTTVRSRRGTERKAKRAKAAEKIAMSVVSIKSGSTSQKKRRSIRNPGYSDPLHYLRKTTNSSKLLTAREEVELSAGVQDLVKLERLHKGLTERFGSEPSFEQWAAAAGVDQTTLRKRFDYGAFCKQKMIKSNIRLVISIARGYQGAGVELQDLVQEGCLGLMRSAEKFDASKGFRFSTYAHWWIKQSVRRCLSQQSRLIRLPLHVVESTYKVKVATKRLSLEKKGDPSREEVAEATGLSLKRLKSVLAAPKRSISLDRKLYNSNIKASDVIANPSQRLPEDVVMREFMMNDLEKVLDSLSPRENQVIRGRYGFGNGRTMTLQEIGELMGISRERVRQIEITAFLKLKHKKRSKMLKQFLTS